MPSMKDSRATIGSAPIPALRMLYRTVRHRNRAGWRTLPASTYALSPIRDNSEIVSDKTAAARFPTRSKAGEADSEPASDLPHHPLSAARRCPAAWRIAGPSRARSPPLRRPAAAPEACTAPTHRRYPAPRFARHPRWHRFWPAGRWIPDGARSRQCRAQSRIPSIPDRGRWAERVPRLPPAAISCVRQLSGNAASRMCASKHSADREPFKAANSDVSGPSCIDQRLQV